MTVKSIQVPADKFNPATAAQKAAERTSTQNTGVQNQSIVSQSTAAATRASEAAVTTLRSSPTGSAEKIRDPEKAEKLALQVADKIKENSKSKDAHAVSDSSARAHLVN